MTQTTPQANPTTWNTVTFTGNLGRDPEMHYTGNGNAVTKFSLAVSQGKDKPAMWLNVETWKQLAEQCDKKLAKGAQVTIEGRLAQDVWEKEGRKHYALKVIAQTVRLLGRATTKAVSGFVEEESAWDDPLGKEEDHPF